VARADGQAWARERGMLFLETSAKEALGVEQAFDEVVHKILENPVLAATTAPGLRKASTLDLRRADPAQSRGSEGSRGCCAA